MNIIQVYKRFPKHEDCVKHLEQVKWKWEPTCPYCKSNKSSVMWKRHHCNNCNTSYSVTVGTIFHRTRLDLQKRFRAITLVLNAKKWISARQIARDLEVNKDTAWRMIMQIRKAMVQDNNLFEWIVEVDETYVWGKEKNKHSHKKTKNNQGRSTKTKTAVFWVANRDTWKVKANVIKDVKRKTLHNEMRNKIKEWSQVMSDERLWYKGTNKKFKHMVVKHWQGQYVDWIAHTNTIEWFWSLFKRWIVGQYHQISKTYMDRYVDEFCYRYNNRDCDNMFEMLIMASVA